MRPWKIGFISLLLVAPANAQDATKIVGPLQAQRNQAMDAWAQCIANASELQQQNVELRKQLDEAKAKSEAK